VSEYAIIRDADKSSEIAFQSVVSILRGLKEHGFDEPIPNRIGNYEENAVRRVGVFIMPGNQAEGMLEDLCLQTVAEHPVMECVKGYFSCLSEVLVLKSPGEPREIGKYYFPKNPSKARAQAFLAGMYDNVASVGLAAKKQYWNFDHPVLADLKAFLAEL